MSFNVISDNAENDIKLWSTMLTASSSCEAPCGRSTDEDQEPAGIPYVGGNSSRLLSEFVIIGGIGRGAFGDVIKVRFLVD